MSHRTSRPYLWKSLDCVGDQGGGRRGARARGRREDGRRKGRREGGLGVKPVSFDRPKREDEDEDGRVNLDRFTRGHGGVVTFQTQKRGLERVCRGRSRSRRESFRRDWT